MNASRLKNKVAVILGHIILRNNDPFGSLTHAPTSESFLTLRIWLDWGLGFALGKQVQNLNSIQHYPFHSHYFVLVVLPILISPPRRPCLGTSYQKAAVCNVSSLRCGTRTAGLEACLTALALWLPKTAFVTWTIRLSSSEKVPFLARSACNLNWCYPMVKLCFFSFCWICIDYMELTKGRALGAPEPRNHSTCLQASDKTTLHWTLRL